LGKIRKLNKRIRELESTLLLGIKAQCLHVPKGSNFSSAVIKDFFICGTPEALKSVTAVKSDDEITIFNRSNETIYLGN
jgi:hypothetical protein